MKLLRYGEPGHERPAVIDERDVVRDISGITADIDGKALSNGLLDRLGETDLSGLPAVAAPGRLAEPVAGVGNFICVGLNYSDHIKESGMAAPEEPVLFLKAVSSICGPNDATILPKNSSKVDWEVELGVVMGREASCVERSEALDYVAGFCVVDDLSERSFQLERSGQWTKGKGCPSFGPFGPYLVTKDEVGDYNDLDLWLDVNGCRMQSGNTSLMVFDVPFLVHYISQFMLLRPGDVISTGTPPGVGHGMNPPVWLKEGDEMRLGIEKLGTQQHTVVACKS